MAGNRVYPDGRQLGAWVPSSGGVNSGDPARVGKVCGVSLNGVATDGTIVLDRRGVYSLNVQGVDQGGNSAVAPGDEIFYTDADPVKLSKKNTGTHFGWAAPGGVVATGVTTTSIPVIVGW